MPGRNHIARGHIEGGAVTVRTPDASLQGDLCVPSGAGGLVLFAHGSGSSRKSPRNREVAAWLQDAGLATLLFDLLTPREDEVDQMTRQYRFDISLLARRLVAAIDWVRGHEAAGALPIGLFGASTGAGAALIAAAERPHETAAVVSRGGRPDLAHDALARVRAPTLLIVGGHDPTVQLLNEGALARLTCEKHLAVVPGATHLFEEPGKLVEVARLASHWFLEHLRPRPEAHAG